MFVRWLLPRWGCSRPALAETPEDLYERARTGLRMPPVEEWVTFPFEGELRIRELLPPDAEEPPRQEIGRAHV